MSKEVLLVDLDDVILDTVSARIHVLNSKFGGNLTVEDIREDNLIDFYNNISNYYNNCKSRNDMYKLFNSRDFWKEVYLVDTFDINVFKELCEKYDLYICTSSNLKAVGEKIVRLEELVGVAESRVIVANDKNIIKGEFIVDDSIQNVHGRTGILFRRSFNTNVQSECSVSSWKELGDLLL